MSGIDVEKNLYTGSLPANSQDEEWLRETAKMGAERLEAYATYDRWYDGDVKPHGLDARAKEILEGEGVPFSENFVEIVVDTVANRLRVDAINVTGNDAATKWLKERLWTPDRLNVLQGVVHVETPKLGDGFVVAGFDGATGRSTFAWNHPRLHRPVYSEDGERLIYDVKRWPTCVVGPQNEAGDPIWRMNVYFEDRIEKWFSSDREGEAWERWLDRKVDGTGEAVALDSEEGEWEWPTPWVDGDGEPLGIPVFHFRNRPQGRAMGRSDVRGAIPFQRELTKQVVDLFYVMDEQGWHQRWGTGIGATEKLRVAIGEFVTAQSPEARFGQFAAEDPTRVVATIAATLTRMSARTGTPLHDLIKGTPPSGEALKTANSARDGRAHNFADVNGPVWAGASRMGWRLEAEFGEGAPAYDPDADLKVVWSPPEDRSEKEEVEISEGRERVGVSKHTVLVELGYDPDEEAKWREEEQKASAEAMARSIVGGGSGGGDDEEDDEE